MRKGPISRLLSGLHEEFREVPQLFGKLWPFSKSLSIEVEAQRTG